MEAEQEAPAGRPLRVLNPKIADTPAAKGNKLLDMTVITWEDIEAATEEEQLQVIAMWLFADIDKKACSVNWIPKDIPDRDGSWPVCKEVPAKPVDQDKCLVYSVGIGGLPEFDVAAEREKKCKVRSFDPTIERPAMMPPSIAFHKLGLSGEDDVSNEQMPVAKLSTLMDMHKEKGQHAYIVKVDCEGCEWDAFTQILQEEGPMALAGYDHVLVEVHMGWLNWTPAKSVALIALLHNAGLQPYWKHFNPWSIARGDTSGLLEQVRSLFGNDLAEEYRASTESFLRLGKEFKTYTAEYQSMWQHHVQPNMMFCCWEYAFFNPNSPSATKKN